MSDFREKDVNDLTDPEITEMLQSTGRMIEQNLARGPGRRGEALFALLVFDDRTAHWVSNAARDTMVKALREHADRMEQTEEGAQIPFPPGDRRPDVSVLFKWIAEDLVRLQPLALLVGQPVQWSAGYVHVEKYGLVVPQNQRVLASAPMDALRLLNKIKRA